MYSILRLKWLFVQSVSPSQKLILSVRVMSLAMVQGKQSSVVMGQTDVREKHRLMPPSYGGGGIIKIGQHDCG